MERLTKRELADSMGEQIVLCNHKESDCNDSCMYGRCEWNKKALQKLKKYEDAEEQGLLLRLPCKVGDKFYHIEDGYIYEFNAEKIEIRKENGEYIYCIDSMEYRKDDFGKIAFFTVEEAEAALARMEKENG